MIDALSVHREPVAKALREIDATLAIDLDGVSAWGPDLRARLVEFASNGKLIRGSLVAASASAFGHEPDPATYTVAAALELIQSFLLIHDDIMDEDEVRRGMPAVYEQYRRLGHEQGYRRADRFGESMGICGGDVAALLAISAVTTIDVPPETRLRITRLVTDEIAKVGVAQMADVANGHSPRGASEEEIIAVYRYKTGRYTFSLPLMLGAILAGAHESVVDALSRWGEIQGIVFQIRDDHLGVMEETDDIGKPAGSDITANKQTLHRLYLLERLPQTTWAEVAGYFGAHTIARRQIERVREALVETGTIAALDDLVVRLREEASQLLDDAGISDEARRALDAIDAFNAGRAR